MTAPKKVSGLSRERLERMCLKKHRWADELAARAGALQSLEASPNTMRLFTYHCPVCKGWHLTRQWSPEYPEEITLRKKVA
jgi:hypothetical protein